MEIKNVVGFEVLDSRGNPTVAAKLTLKSGAIGLAISPSGASTGIHEAHELRDGDKNRFGGKGVMKATENINIKIRNAINGKKFYSQKEFDSYLIELDSSENKSVLGANAILAVSLAFAKASACENKLELYKYIGGENARILPRPMMNILNGGVHAANNVDIQEFMIVPVYSCSFSDGLRKCAEIYHTLGSLLKDKNLLCGIGDEGGFSPNLKNDEEAIELICEAIKLSGNTTDEIKIALDVASSEWYSDGKYQLPKSKITKSADELIKYYCELTEKYPIISIEDPFSEDDWNNWQKLTDILGSKVQLVGDDLFVTNRKRLEEGIIKNVGNSILIKPNQIGTLTETMDVVRIAKENGYKTILSHRSGESEDTSIADISVGLNAGQIKSGAPARSDRTSKYNRLLMIEKEICN